MTKPTSEYVVIGKVGAAYGIKGWLRVHSFADTASKLLDYHPWYLAEGSSWQPYTLEDARVHGKGFVAKIKGFDTPEEARKLSGKEIAIKREQLAKLPANEYYWADLEGLMVIDQKGEALGRVLYLIETGSNDVLVIKDKNGREQGIPYLPGQVVKEVDLNQGIIRVDWDLL